MNEGARTAAFRRLHERGGAFVMPNPHDIGTARILASLGFEALATTSAGMAFTLGRKDGEVSRREAIEHCRQIVAATELPVSADLESGFGEAPETVAETLEMAIGAGLAGCSIEDYADNADAPIFERSLAVERIAAAAETRQSLCSDFVLTARCENFLRGRPDLDDTIGRLQAYGRAGADVLYAPGLRDLDTVRAVCDAVGKPVNVLLGMPGLPFGVAELEAAGVRRISIGSALSRAAFGAFIQGAREIRDAGTVTFIDEAPGFADIDALIGR